MATHTMSTHSIGARHSASSIKSNVHSSHYFRFVVMILVSSVAMYVLMYAMVDVLPNVYNSFNQAYMAGLMAASMGIIEILLMRSMYPSSKINAGILIVSTAMLALFWSGIRNQVGVGDRQFVRSMIPHHAGAILMCREASVRDAELKALCARIVEGQQAEIDQMNAIYNRLSD